VCTEATAAAAPPQDEGKEELLCSDGVARLLLFLSLS